MRIVSWNINSVRLRIDLVARLAAELSPDVICLQETKCPDDAFPMKAVRAMGYEHTAIFGQKGYHGVAIASRRPLSNSRRRDFCAKGDARHICVSLKVGARDIELHNFYVPAGGDEPDPQINPKFAHKLAFFDELSEWAKLEKTHARDSILVGDINVAPLETDVWSHKALLKVVSHTPIEVERFETAMRAGMWVDAMRKFVPAEQKLYTWWSYRSPDWERADKGRRLDHIWVSPSLADSIAGLQILKDARGWDRPSDHVPVSIEVFG